MNLICRFCEDILLSGSDLCRLPCGHVNHVACLRELSKEPKECCGKRFHRTVSIRSRVYFHSAPNTDNQTYDTNNETVQESSLVLLANAALKGKLEERTAELEAVQTRCLNLEQKLSNSQAKIRDFEGKFAQTDVGQLVTLLEKKSESLKNCEVFSLKNSLDTMNIELEKERKLRCNIAEKLEKKDAEADKLFGENAKVKRELSDCTRRLADAESRACSNLTEITRLLTEVTKVSNENERKKHELTGLQLRFDESEKRIADMINEKEKTRAILAKLSVNFKWKLRKFQKSLADLEKQIADMNKEKAEMAETELKRWDSLDLELVKVQSIICKNKAESKNKQRLQQQNTPSLVPMLPPTALKRQFPNSGSGGDLAKRARVVTQTKFEEDNDKEATNVASCSRADISS